MPPRRASLVGTAGVPRPRLLHLVGWADRHAIGAREERAAPGLGCDASIRLHRGSAMVVDAPGIPAQHEKETRPAAGKSGYAYEPGTAVQIAITPHAPWPKTTGVVAGPE